MEESKFPKAVLNYSPRGKREGGFPRDAGEIYEVVIGNNAQTTECRRGRIIY